MSTAGSKKSTSVSLDEKLVETLDEVPGVKRSTLLNELGWEWVEEHGHGERPE
jgi:metal-responsive CopG/Arc/MetJ family transcriptional regulator